MGVISTHIARDLAAMRIRELHAAAAPRRDRAEAGMSSTPREPGSGGTARQLVPMRWRPRSI